MRRAPVGVVAGIIPWNVPLFISAMKLGPAMSAGCPIVLKPSPETPLDGYLLADAVAEADLPPGVVNIVAAGRETGEHLVRHPGIDKVSFTGSTAVGRYIGSICGEQIKRCTLELGGKRAAIVLDDWVIDDASLGNLMMSGLMNNGQACGAQTRILVSDRRYDEVVEALGAAVGALKTGDPLADDTNIGPLVARRQQERVEGLLEAGKAAGATAVVGGGVPADLPTGWYIEPTVFANVTNDMSIAREEIFGPVLSVLKYGDEAEADRDRERLRLRPLRLGVDRRPRPRRRGRDAGAHRCGRDQQLADPRLQRAVRRVQGVGHRPRARPRGHRALHRVPVDHPACGVVIARDVRSFPASLAVSWSSRRWAATW